MSDLLCREDTLHPTGLDADAQAVLVACRREPGRTGELRFWMVNLSNGLLLMQDVQVQVNALVDGIGAELAP